MRQILMTLLASTCVFTDASSSTQAVPTPAVFDRGDQRNARLWRNINVYRDNPLVMIDRAVDRRFSPVIEIESVRPVKDENGNDSHIYGSGFMISPCYALTNHHVVFGDDRKIVPNKNYDMVVRAGVGKSAVFAGSTLAVPVSWGSEDDGANDWAIIRLRSCIGLRSDVGWFKIRFISDMSFLDREIMAVGHPAMLDRGVLATSLGKVVGVDLNTGMLKTTASWAQGQSGGPVLYKDGEAYIASGMITAEELDSRNPRDSYAATYSDDRANKFTSIGFILECPTYRNLVFSASQSAENADYFSRRIPLQYPRFVARNKWTFDNGRWVCESSLETAAS